MKDLSFLSLFLLRLRSLMLTGLIVLIGQACSQEEKTAQNKGKKVDTKALADSMNTAKEEEDTKKEWKIDEAKLRLILEGYFAKYAEKDFNALKDYYTPEVLQFIRLKDIKREAVSKTAINFFKGKDKIQFTPDFSRLHIESQNNQEFQIELPLTMAWQYEQAPTEDEVQQGIRTYLYQYQAKVLLSITFDKQYKIKAYTEKETLIDKYKIKAQTEAQNVVNTESKVVIKEGVVVADGLETRELTRQTDTGEQTLVQRKVKYKGNFYWITDGVKEAGSINLNLYLEKIDSE